MKPVIAVVMGDAAGIGPELVVKVLSQPDVFDRCRPLLIGDAGVMRQTCDSLGAALRFREVGTFAEARFSPDAIDILRPEGLQIDHVPRGQADAAMGQVVARCLQTAFDLAMTGDVQGVVAAPLNKEALHRAGYDYPDELAFLADYTGSTQPFILAAMASLWVVTVTEHIAFRDVASHITQARVAHYIEILTTTLHRLGYDQPRIAVAALNPHAGEGGLFGREEIDQIEPAVREAAARNLRVSGPVPADMVFVRALAGDFDGVVSMYHDQANIARKLQPKSQSVTLLMGLPVIYGTTAHGTAFDIAGKGIADPGSLTAALDYVIRLAG